MYETDWRKVTSDPSEIKLFEALEDSKWEWRTVSALSRATGMSEDDARRIIRKYPTLIKQSAISARSGEDLYTLKRRYFERKSTIEKIWTAVSSSTSST